MKTPTLRHLLACAATLWALCTPLAADAIPAYPARTWLTLTDGTRVEATFQGDEHGYCYVTDDGRIILADANGGYAFATNDEANAWQTFTRQARAEANRAIMERNPRLQALSRQSATEITTAPSHVAITGKPYAFEGTRRGLVILANFADKKFTYSHDDFDNLLNQPGYGVNYHLGSLHDYFLDQSYGKFDFEFDVVGPVELSQPAAYYGADGEWGVDTYKVDMIIEAAIEADRHYDVDYTQYDWDGDGEIELLFVVYAGYGQHYAGNSTDYIWPSSGCIYPEMEVRLDDMILNTIACSSEIDGLESAGRPRVTGIGTLTHEFSHCFGLPDLYDTQAGTLHTTMGHWDLMCSGSYNGRIAGSAPMGFSAYERWLCGWLEFTELTEPEAFRAVPSVDNEPVAFRYVNPSYPNEYFIMEHRSNDRWFAYNNQGFSQAGLLVTHIDYSYGRWYYNTVNSIDYEHCGLVTAGTSPADYIFNGRTYTQWNGLTHYDRGARLYNPGGHLGAIADIEVRNISRENGLLAFDFDRLSAMGIDETKAPEVVELKLSPRANGRLKTRQPVIATLHHDGDGPIFDYIALGHALVPSDMDPEEFAANPPETLSSDSDPVPVSFPADEEKTLTLSYYIVPRTAGTYYVALEGTLSGRFGHTFISFGNTLPEGIDGIEIDAPNAPRHIKRIDGHRVTIVRDGIRYDLNGRRV